MLTIYSKHACVLFDSGATHSFVSHIFTKYVNKKLKPLSDFLLVHTHVGNSIMIEHVYHDCELLVNKISTC